MSELPVRPRRKLVTPVTATLAGVLLVALGFIGGVEVQKGQGSSSAANAAARFGQGRTFPSGGAAPGGNATVGTVADVHGKTLYVTGTDGTTVKVKTNANTKVTRNAVSREKAVHPGDTVVVQGPVASNGTVKASRVSATARNAAGGGLGGFNGGGAADPPGQR
jgi:hypothetical protein